MRKITPYTIIGMAMLAALGSACKSAQTAKPLLVPPASEVPIPSQADSLTPTNDVAAQGSIREAIAASGKVFVKDGSYRKLTAASMQAVAPGVRYGLTPSTSYGEVSFQVRGDTVLALASMSPSGVCFGALSQRDAFTYSHSDIGQMSCDAADVPYSTHGW